MYRNTPYSTTRETAAQLILGQTKRLQFDALMSNTSEVVIELKISQIKNGGNRTVSFNTYHYTIARDYKNNNKLQKGNQNFIS